MQLDWTYLGLVPYSKALRLQYGYARHLERREGNPFLFLMQHPPVITLGRRSRPEHLLLEPEEYRKRGIELVEVKRGGGPTFHGPGQLVGYPVARLDLLGVRVPDWVRGCASALQNVLDSHGIRAEWSEQAPGLWVGEAKIAAFGFHIVRKVISTHGFALNVDVDLANFETFVPCGLPSAAVTSVRAQGSSVSLRELTVQVACELAKRFGLDARWKEAEEIVPEDNY
ncbi:MAG: lipoyl(octanoyl) transferase [Deltaproteobacteria bacterium]|nr:MAG: lipoyl(octanoyl) transferase [Deltaproteobacteria bacterium]